MIRAIKRTAWMLLPVALSLLAGAVLILVTGQNPILTYANLFEAGFSCNPGPGRCALVTALQFAIPLILNGLSATVALRSGFFSIGQAGQMLFGAAAASWLAGYLSLPPIIHPAVALVGAALLGGFWGLVPALLKHFIGVNEIIVTLLLNPIAGVLVGLVRLPRVDASARLLPLIPSTKLSAGVWIALGAALLVYLLLWRTTKGMEMRTNGDAPRLALYSGMPIHKPVLVAMVLSGALADLLLKLERLNLPAAAPPGFEHLGFTVTPGTIFHGGSYPSIVPDSATAVVDIRLLPGQSSAEVLEVVRDQIRTVEHERPRIDFEMKVTVNIPGAFIAKDHPLALLAQDYTEAVTGRRWDTAGAGPANEGYMLIEAGIPTLCGFGPTGGNPHAPDEWVEIKSLPATVAMFAGIVHDYLSLSK